MDMVTLEQAKSYTDSQRLAYTDVRAHYATFNGDLTGKETFSAELLNSFGTFVKLSNHCVTKDELKEIRTLERNNVIGGQFTTYKLGEFDVIEDEFSISVISLDGLPLMLVFFENIPVDDTTTLTAGTYGYYADYHGDNLDGDKFTCDITYETETIHKIDPKYLPEVTADPPVVIALSGNVLLNNLGKQVSFDEASFSDVSAQKEKVVEQLRSIGTTVMNSTTAEESIDFNVYFLAVSSSIGMLLVKATQLAQSNGYYSFGAMFSMLHNNEMVSFNVVFNVKMDGDNDPSKVSVRLSLA